MSDRRRVPLNEKGLPVRKEDAAVAPDDSADDADGPCDCPRLEAADWDGVESDWSDITFVRATTNAVLGVPVGYDGVKDDLRKKAAQAGVTVPEGAMQLNGAGKFRRPVLLEVEGAADGAKGIERPGGVAFTKLFEAPWGELKKVAKKTTDEAKARYGREPDNLWIWYLTCKHCSKERNFETLVIAHYGSRA